VVLVPVYGRIEPACEAGLRELEARGYPVRRVYGYSAIDQARSAIATAALDDGFAELMWIDADIAFAARDVDRLRAYRLPLCCGIYPTKGVRRLACDLGDAVNEVKFGEQGGPLAIRRCGMGFVHTRRVLYETIARTQALPVCNEIYGERVVPYFLPMVAAEDGGHTYLAEDYAFCERARRAGFAIVADTSIRLWHMGTYGFGWEDAGRDVERYAHYLFHVSR
jgi:hypothetical protein